MIREKFLKANDALVVEKLTAKLGYEPTTKEYECIDVAIKRDRSVIIKYRGEAL